MQASRWRSLLRRTDRPIPSQTPSFSPLLPGQVATRKRRPSKKREREVQMEMGAHVLASLLVAVLYVCVQVSVAQVVIPAKIDGFVYEGALPKADSIVIEAFFDPLCPDSRDAWPPLKQAFKHYAPRISLAVHTFPLPYHDNAFVSSRALHIVNKLNSSATYPLLEHFFKYQEKYYNRPTQNLPRKSITDDIAKFAAKAAGSDLLSSIQRGFEDGATDMATRIAFKYGCSRGVTGTPYFFVNGFPLPDGGDPVDFNKWRSFIDPLVGKQ